MSKKIVFLTGAGISQESGVKTFRDKDGHWNCVSIDKYASIRGFRKDPQTVLDFYNERRNEISNLTPNKAHVALAELEAKNPNVHVITQNVDDFHERAGTKNLIHLHGKINHAREVGSGDSFPWSGDINVGDMRNGNQMRPDVVWFGEDVPMMNSAVELIQNADELVIIGTSLLVYPASSLLDFFTSNKTIHYLDPTTEDFTEFGFNHIQKTACDGIDEIIDHLDK